MSEFNTKKYVNAAPGMLFKLRIWYKEETKRRAAHYVVKCGCCNEKIDIYPAVFGENDGVEIGGVIAPKSEWRKFLLPLLK